MVKDGTLRDSLLFDHLTVILLFSRCRQNFHVPLSTEPTQRPTHVQIWDWYPCFWWRLIHWRPWLRGARSVSPGQRKNGKDGAENRGDAACMKNDGKMEGEVRTEARGPWPIRADKTSSDQKCGNRVYTNTLGAFIGSAW